MQACDMTAIPVKQPQAYGYLQAHRVQISIKSPSAPTLLTSKALHAKPQTHKHVPGRPALVAHNSPPLWPRRADLLYGCSTLVWASIMPVPHVCMVKVGKCMWWLVSLHGLLLQQPAVLFADNPSHTPVLPTQGLQTHTAPPHAFRPACCLTLLLSQYWYIQLLPSVSKQVNLQQGLQGLRQNLSLLPLLYALTRTHTARQG